MVHFRRKGEEDGLSGGGARVIPSRVTRGSIKPDSKVNSKGPGVMIACGLFICIVCFVSPKYNC